VVWARIASQTTMKLARVVINVFAALTDGFVHDAVKLVTKIISG
jgi:hypothetical protein